MSSASSKYANLPDVDFDQPDLYESEDPKVIPDSSENETEDSECKKTSILAAVSSLKKKLDSVSNNPIFFNQSDSLADSSTSWKKYYESVSSDKTSTINTAQRNNTINSVSVAEFERRLSAIENAISPSSDIASTSTHNVPLSVSINELKTKVELLTNPKFLESVSKRAKFASEELDKLSKSKEILSSLASEQDKDATSQDKFQSAQDVLTRANQEKIATLYEKLPSLEPMTLLIPSLLDRLDNLSKLHVKAASVVESFSHVDDFINVTQKSKLSDLTQIVETLQSSIESNSALMVNNVKELEQRMANLSK
ncbi:Dynactin subunit 2 [Smittium culicis]|uniref:Dynactin subunit 2 n=1 Tax=Smittium culicis TaxID=133412 RepID=A0A1R1YS76_9FUNG|nr:Dynactin subunit 2 [Smittium culicis]